MSDLAPPRILPVFPLTGALLLPEGVLPLHIFEPRYRHMVADAAADAGYIGMIQPVVPRRDNQPPPDAPPETPELYPVGCAGRMDRVQELPDGRYLIVLRGVRRFRVVEELALHNGYRRVVADYAPYDGDEREAEAAVDAAPLLEALERYTASLPQPPSLDELRDMPGPTLTNGLAMALPFTPMEKQALLEARDVAERARLVLELMRMGGPDVGEAEVDRSTPPSYN